MGAKAAYLSASQGRTSNFFMVPQGVTSSVLTSEVEQLVAVAGTISQLRVKTTAALGDGNSYTFTLRVNGSNTALTCAVSGGTATSAEDLTHSVSVSAGDRISVGVTIGGTPSATHSGLSMVFDGSGSVISLGLSAASHSADSYIGAFGRINDSWDTTLDTSEQMICPIAGTIRGFYVRVNLTGNDAGESVTYTIIKNGSPEATSTITIAELSGTQAANVTGLNIAVAAGDTLGIFFDLTGTVSAGALAGAIAFEPSVSGQCPWSFSSSTHDTVNPTYSGYGNHNDSSLTSEANFQVPMPDCRFRNLQADVTVAPGAGNSWDFDVRIDTGGGFANGNNHVDIDGAAATSGSNTANDVFNAGERMAIRITPVSVPTSPGVIRIAGIIQFQGGGGGGGGGGKPPGGGGGGRPPNKPPPPGQLRKPALFSNRRSSRRGLLSIF